MILALRRLQAKNPCMSRTSQTAERTQTWNAAEYAANGRFVADLAGEVFRMLAPRAGERILDLGCGDGALTQQIAATGANVVGCDADPSMLSGTAARGLATVQSDMRSLPFHGEFDAVFSNAALHWVREQDAVLQGVHRALRPGGRFVAEMGGLGNIAAIRTALQATLSRYGIDAEAAGASFYPSADEYRLLLERNGFSTESMALVPRPTRLDAGMEQWLRTFRKGALASLSEPNREAAVSQTASLLKPMLCDSNGVWWGDYVRLRFHAVHS
jgi:SAM-dependent methyltransferase